MFYLHPLAKITINNTIYLVHFGKKVDILDNRLKKYNRLHDGELENLRFPIPLGCAKAMIFPLPAPKRPVWKVHMVLLTSSASCKEYFVTNRKVSNARMTLAKLLPFHTNVKFEEQSMNETPMNPTEARVEPGFSLTMFHSKQKGIWRSYASCQGNQWSYPAAKPMSHNKN